MNRLMLRVLVLSVFIGLSAVAVIFGCASNQARPTGAAGTGGAEAIAQAPTTSPTGQGWYLDGHVGKHGTYTFGDFESKKRFVTRFNHSGNEAQDLGAAPQPQSEEADARPQRRAVDNASPSPASSRISLFAQTQPAEPSIQPPDLKKPDDVVPGSGQLMARLPDKLVPVPLKHTDVKASIAGYIATVDVRQQYQNPYSEKIEATYVFPLPTNAAVNEFIMTIGQRKIRGIIREREEAKKIYENAKSRGYVASLLTQERPNIFTQAVANIEPGKQIDVNIKYFHTLEYTDGWYEFVFPMVVGPRFNPPGMTDGVGAVGRGDRGISGQQTEVQYLRPEERSGHDIALAVEIDAGVKVEKIESVNHKVKVEPARNNVASVALDSADSIPNKDFVLRYKVAGERVKSGLIVQRDEKGGGYFTLMLFPPENLKNLPRKPLEMVFTLDVSGSMTGRPIEQAKAAIGYALTHMRQDDTFNVIRFASAAEEMSPRALPATPENVQNALAYVQSMNAGGGTMMIEGIRRSLAVSPDDDRLRFVSFLTDGYIGNEAEILREIHNLKGATRIFSFGVGQSTNRYLLDHMAKMGAGCAAYLSLNDDAAKIMADYFDRISHPALTNIAVDFGGMQVSDVYPQKMPDLFVGRPVIITGRFTGAGDAKVRVAGKVGGEVQEIALPVRFDDSQNHKGIAAVWARAKIGELFDRATYESNPELPQAVKEVALQYGLMSAYTAFVAVDSSAPTAGDHGTSVAVPVPVPQGVRYETTVQNANGVQPEEAP